MSPRRKGLTKTQSLRIHSKKRALQRFGLDLSSDSLEEISNLIRGKKAPKNGKRNRHRSRQQIKGVSLVLKQSINKSVYDITYKGKRLRVVYDKKRKTPVTFLDPNVELRWGGRRVLTQPWYEFPPELYKENQPKKQKKKKPVPVIKDHFPKRKKRRMRGRQV